MRTAIILVIVILLVNSASVFAFEVSSGFGWRTDPITHQRKFHSGIDIPINAGIPILAVFPGKVVMAGPYGGYGNAVLLHHQNNTYTLYGHCSVVIVRPGEMVKTGQTIALAGSTGKSTGPHLHLEYWVYRNKVLTYDDPMKLWKTKIVRASNKFTR